MSSEVNRVIRAVKPAEPHVPPPVNPGPPGPPFGANTSTSQPIIERCKPYSVRTIVPTVSEQLKNGWHSYTIMMGPSETSAMVLQGLQPLALYNVIVGDTIGKFTHYLFAETTPDGPLYKVVLQNQSLDDQRTVTVMWM